MTSEEIEFMISVMNSLKAIAHELKKANELRAVEMRLRYKPGESPRIRVDEIMEDEL